MALGGGGYNLGAVARVWALEYALMLGVELPDAIPASYGDQYGVHRLRDAGDSVIPEDYRDFVRTFAETTVGAVHSEIFPLHGLSAS